MRAQYVSIATRTTSMWSPPRRQCRLYPPPAPTPYPTCSPLLCHPPPPPPPNPSLLPLPPPPPPSSTRYGHFGCKRGLQRYAGEPQTPNSKPRTPNPKPQTPNPKLSTPNSIRRRLRAHRRAPPAPCRPPGHEPRRSGACNRWLPSSCVAKRRAIPAFFWSWFCM